MNNLSFLQNKKIGILGAGYIGLNLFEYIDKYKDSLNIDVVLLNRSNVTMIEYTKFDYFVNCAGNSGDFRQQIFETVESNVSLIIYLLKNLKVKEKFISLSSSRIYGFNTNPNIINYESNSILTNHTDLNFIYDGSKALQESIISNYSKKIDYTTIIIRLTNVYGKFKILDDATLIKKIIRCNMEGRELNTNVNSQSTKDYLYIDDALNGIINGLNYCQNHDIFNIGSGISTSLKKIAEILNININFVAESNEPVYSNISIDKAMKVINFKPIQTFETGLIKTCNEFKK